MDVNLDTTRSVLSQDDLNARSTDQLLNLYKRCTRSKITNDIPDGDLTYPHAYYADKIANILMARGINPDTGEQIRVKIPVEKRTMD